jgi:hypothetical protein
MSKNMLHDSDIDGSFINVKISGLIGLTMNSDKDDLVLSVESYFKGEFVALLLSIEFLFV